VLQATQVTADQHAAALAAAQAAAAEAAAPAPLRDSLVAKPKFFSGSLSGPSVKEWLYSNELAFYNLRLAADEPRVNFAVQFLEGPATTWWTATQASEAIWTWDLFKAALRLQFSPEDEVVRARDKLDHLRQLTSVRDYNQKFRELATYIPDAADGDMLHRYQRGLKDFVAQHVTVQQPGTLTEAMTLALNIDTTATALAYRQAADRRPWAINRRPIAYPAHEPQPMELGALSSAPGGSRGGHGGRGNRGRRGGRSGQGGRALGFGEPRLSPAEEKRLRDEKRCFKCREKGHFARDCPLR